MSLSWRKRKLLRRSRRRRGLRRRKWPFLRHRILLLWLRHDVSVDNLSSQVQDASNLPSQCRRKDRRPPRNLTHAQDEVFPILVDQSRCLNSVDGCPNDLLMFSMNLLRMPLILASKKPPYRVLALFQSRAKSPEKELRVSNSPSLVRNQHHIRLTHFPGVLTRIA